ncbi:MAG: cytochrome c oxidase subunit 3 family protein [Planctomycetes bacterium]|nr:cytochrome c oxidase subunit 3 family protein [Planctomycetota bacterium]
MSSVDATGLAHHFEDLEQQREAATLGMWAFLVTEIMFFGGLFGAYVVYRTMYPQAWDNASNQLDVLLGAVNTTVLIVSSLTMALAVRCAAKGNNRQVAGFTFLTLLLGFVFLGVKVIEYKHKWDHHLMPGPNFQLDGVVGGHEQIFFALYFAMTGMHAFHMIIGAGLMLWVILKALRNDYTPQNHTHVEMIGLYWHFVDIVWIFLFPLLYLLGKHGHAIGAVVTGGH